MQHVMEEPPLPPLPKNILPDEPSPPGAKPCSSPAQQRCPWHTQSSLSCQQVGSWHRAMSGTCVSLRGSALSSLPQHGSTRSPLCAISRRENLQYQNPREQRWRFWALRREVGGRSCLVPTSNIHISAQMDLNTLRRMLPQLCCMVELIQHFSSFLTAHAHPRLRGPYHKPDRSSVGICSDQHIPAAAEPSGSKPSQQPHAGCCRAGNPEC